MRKRKVSADDLAPLWDGLKRAIMSGLGKYRTRRGPQDVPLPKIYKIVSRGDERWER